MRKNFMEGILLLIVIAICSIGFSGCGNSSKGIFCLHADIAPIKDDKKAIITIVSDDGFYDSGVNLNELAEKYNFRVTVAGVVDHINKHLDEWKKIEQGGHIELISHSYSHYKMSEEANYSYEELEHQIKDSIEWFRANFVTDQIAFVPPENTMCQKGYDLLKASGIYAVRQGTRELNSLSPMKGTLASQWFNLYTAGICDLETTEWRNSLVDTAIEYNAWLIEMWHNVYREGQDVGYQGLTYEMADEHMKYLLERKEDNSIWVASFTEATKYIYEKQNASLKVILNNDKIIAEVSTDISKLPADIFDFPLTLKIPLPLGWNSVAANDENNAVWIKTDNDVKYIIVNVVPNSSPITINKVN